ncbi:Williams-Beuren syndrome chromosome region 16, isoform CRA_b, partial [mine drainage metagenome]
DCVLALSDKGEVFGWGNSEYGQLGMVTSEQQVGVSRCLGLEKQLGKVVSVAAGGSMCGLVNGECVWVCV